MTKIWLIAAVVGLGWLSLSAASAQKPKHPGRRVVDEAGAVSFAFPAGWVREPDEFAPEPGDYYVPAILTLDVPGRRVRISLHQNPFPGTGFTGLAFASFNVQSRSESECLAPWKSGAAEGGSTVNEKPGEVTVNGVDFHTFTTANAGMCHQASGKVYATYRGGRCYLFEADVYSHCGVDGETMLTPAQYGVLRRKVEGLAESIRFDGAK